MANILFVMSFGGPNANESALISLLEGAGHTVTSLPTGSANVNPWPTEPGEYDAVVQSATGASFLSDWEGFRALTEGIVTSFAVDHLLTSGVNNGVLQTAVNIVNEEHPIASGAGLSNGSVTVYTGEGAATIRLTGMAAGGVSIADYATMSQPVIAAFEQGAELTTGTAAGRRVYLAPLTANNLWTEDAEALFLSAVDWAAGGGADTTPPTLSNAAAQATGATTGSGSVDTDTGEGTLYWVVTTSSTAPSAAQVQAGTDENDTAAADSGSQAVIATGTQAITGGFTGLSAGTTYYAHYQHQDAAENDSAVASSSAFTTHSAITGDAAGTSSDSGTADLAISITGEASGTSSDSGTVTQTYSISGTVTSSGEAVEGALIYLIDQSSDSVIDTETTGADGTYSFTGLSAGTYHAAVEYEGFAAPSVSFIKLGGD